MKILHLATDDKFLDHAFPVFEKVYPNANDVIVFSQNYELEHIKLKSVRVVKEVGSPYKRVPKVNKGLYQIYDLIILHSLESSICSEVQNMPAGIPIIWLGWGFDYYNDVLHHIPLLLEKTQLLASRSRAETSRQKIILYLKKVLRAPKLRNRKIKAIERIAVFCPVLPSEYELVVNSRGWRSFPQFSSWNYGTMEDNLIKGLEEESVCGDSILVGNSATYSNNHIEAFDLLRLTGKYSRNVIVPLSYGSKQYSRKILEIGDSYFGEDFEPLLDFLPIEKYTEIIKRCGYVIMNHVRQQAVGNIVIMLYLGARVFVRSENPVYDFFIDAGVVISTVQELEADHSLLDTPLTLTERSKNRAIVSDYWSRDKAYERTRDLVNKAIALKQQKQLIAIEANT